MEKRFYVRFESERGGVTISCTIGDYASSEYLDQIEEFLEKYDGKYMFYREH